MATSELEVSGIKISSKGSVGVVIVLPARAIDNGGCRILSYQQSQRGIEMGNEKDDFSSFLGSFSADMAERARVASLSADDVISEARKFNSDCNDVMQNIVLPVFREVVAVRTEGFKAEIENQPSKWRAGLFLFIREKYPYFLRFSDKTDRKRIAVERVFHNPDKTVEIAAFRPSEVTSEEVRKQVREFLEEIQGALSS